jgi:hypothetical protein
MEPISAFKFINFNFEGIEAEVLYRKRPSAGQAKTHPSWTLSGCTAGGPKGRARAPNDLEPPFGFR